MKESSAVEELDPPHFICGPILLQKSGSGWVARRMGFRR